MGIPGDDETVMPVYPAVIGLSYLPILGTLSRRTLRGGFSLRVLSEASGNVSHHIYRGALASFLALNVLRHIKSAGKKEAVNDRKIICEQSYC